MALKARTVLKNEIRPLTGIRGVAAFLVMAYHFFTYTSFISPVTPWFHKSYLCVDLFFVLSGFVLTMRHEKDFLKNASWKRFLPFMKSRIARIYPAYVIILAIFYLKWLAGATYDHAAVYRPQDLSINLLLLQSWGFGTPVIVNDAWSVSTEMAAYLLFPLLLLLACTKKITAVILFLTALSFLTSISLSPFGINGPLDVSQDYQSFFPLLRCFAGFAIGMLAFRCTHNPLGGGQKPLYHEITVAVVLAGIALSLAFDPTDIITVLLFAALVSCLFHDGKLSRALFGNRIIHHLGAISYSLYLIHPLFRGMAGYARHYAQTHWHISSLYGFALLGMAAAWAGAYACYRLIEVPARKKINSLAAKRQKNRVS